ncbi:MAG: RNA polymerase sigma factor [Acidobacteria bacterium]|nr:RNA polymerase sigma factor [Acidobacteriota bacterium]
MEQPFETAFGMTGKPAEEPVAGRLRRLFEEISEGRPRALEELYDSTSRRLYGLALWRTGRTEDAEEVVQEVFVRLAHRRLELRRVKNPQAWLLAVTHRLAVDLTRRRRVRRSESLEDASELLAPAVDPVRAIDGSRISARLRELPAAQREVLYLKHFAGHSFAEIGAIVGVPTFTAASRYRRGLAQLQKLLQEEPT